MMGLISGKEKPESALDDRVIFFCGCGFCPFPDHQQRLLRLWCLLILESDFEGSIMK
jgi:hypothetical protein